MQRTECLHLGLELLSQLLQLLLAWGLLLPADAETFLFVRLGDHMEVNVVDFLMGVATVVLENVVLLGTRGYGDLLQDRLFQATCQSSTTHGARRKLGYAIQEPRSIGRRGCRGAWCRGTWE